jgi:hypothetical protein
MKFQVGEGWLVGQVLIPGSTILDYGDKQDHELSPPETIAKGKIPPVDSLALDADSALALWRAYPHCRERLRRNLDEINTEIFRRLLEMDNATLERFWK